MHPPRCSLDSTTLARGLAGPIGVPEVSSGMPSPPISPPLAAYAAATEKTVKPRRGGAAFTITEESERLFCETLKAVFLGEGNLVFQDSLVTGMQGYDLNNDREYHYEDDRDDLLGPSNAIAVTSAPPVRLTNRLAEQRGCITRWVEAFDYVGGARFRGFVAEKSGIEPAMFIFFDEGVVGRDLKPGLMALLELCGISEFETSRLVVCIDRSTEPQQMRALMKELGWVGFEPMTLEEWTDADEIVSDEWILMGVEV